MMHSGLAHMASSPDCTLQLTLSQQLGLISAGHADKMQSSVSLPCSCEGQQRSIQQALEGSGSCRFAVDVCVLHAPRFCILCPQQLKVHCLVALPMQSQRCHQDEELQDPLRSYDVHLSNARKGHAQTASSVHSSFRLTVWHPVPVQLLCCQ